MKKFFVSMEEKFVFPIGRRTWQILSLLALVGLAAFIVWFVINLTPTSRGSVKISKSEVSSNQIDTVAVVSVQTEPVRCKIEDYNRYIDTLKKDMPSAEWVNLGDSSEAYSNIVTDDYGNYLFDENGDYIYEETRTFIPNPNAIPNILNSIYESLGLDSSQLCERIDILKKLHLLNSYTEKNFLAKEAFQQYAYLLINNRSINEIQINKSAELKSRIDGENVLVKNTEGLEDFTKYIRYVGRKNISDEQINICIGLIDQHRELSSSSFNKKKYFDLAELIFESSLPIAELKIAVTGFEDDLEYYDKNDLDRSLSRYLKLYEEKLAYAEMEKRAKEIKKESNRAFSLLAMGICFASIISIATILLLYSIQQLLKDHTNSKS